MRLREPRTRGDHRSAIRREYGLAVYQDENSNGKLDRNFVDIPKESVAPAKRLPSFGPPVFDRARFTCSGGGKAVTIHIRYL